MSEFYATTVSLIKLIFSINPLSANPEKWSNTLRQIVGNLPTICLSVFDHFINLALKGLRIKDTADFKLQHKSVNTTHPVDVWKMLSPEMYLLMLRYFYGITEAVVQRCSVKKLF